MQRTRELFILKNHFRWNSEYYAIRCIIVRLLGKKNQGIKKLFDELRLTPFTPNEQFPKEHTRIIRCITDAFDVLQGEKNIGLGYQIAFGYAPQSFFKLPWLV